MQDFITLQIALRKGYPILTIVKPIKYNKKKNIRPFKTTLRASKQKK